MAISPVDRDPEYMKQMWGTKSLITDYVPEKSDNRVIQEVLHDLAPKHCLGKQTELHEKIRNDEDYDDWDYGTEPSYGVNPKKYLQM